MVRACHPEPQGAQVKDLDHNVYHDRLGFVTKFQAAIFGEDADSKIRDRCRPPLLSSGAAQLPF